MAGSFLIHLVKQLVHNSGFKCQALSAHTSVVAEELGSVLLASARWSQDSGRAREAPLAHPLSTWPFIPRCLSPAFFKWTHLWLCSVRAVSLLPRSIHQSKSKARPDLRGQETEPSLHGKSYKDLRVSKAHTPQVNLPHLEKIWKW
jgi:hypothetical protein